jgi:UDP-N-acetylmuramoyl-tripeptide--D-alanyl-D-alanine ligase
MEDFITFQNVLDWTGARHVLGRKPMSLAAVSVDSRTIQPSEIFVALSGPTYNGNDYAAEAVKKGAAAVLLSEIPSDGILDDFRKKGIAVGIVPNGLKAVQHMAAEYRKNFAIPIVGITGSCGKTTVKDFAHSIFQAQGTALKNEGTLNNHLGVPLTLLKLRRNHKACFLEMGTSSPGEIRYLTQIAAPTHGVLLNIGAAHLRMLKDLQGVLNEKWALIESVSPNRAVLNEDDPNLQKKIQNSPGCISFGIYSGGQIQASKIEFYKNEFSRFVVLFEGKELGLIKVPFVGLHNIYNVLAALSIGYALGLDWSFMMKHIARLQLPSMRWETQKVNGVVVINDAYNANPKSMASALDTFGKMNVEGKKIFVCGDMLDLGSDEEYWHRSLGTEVVKAGVHILITVGVMSKWVGESAREKGFSKNSVFSCENHQEVLDVLKSFISSGDTVLVKGSRGMSLEKAVELLNKHLQKETRTVLVL